MTDDLAPGPGRQLSTSTAISLSLVLTLLIGTVVVGRYLQKIDDVERDLSEVRLEVRQVREILLRGYSAAQPTR